MKPLLTSLVLSTFLLCGYGQGVEQFIPIGQSPGVSGMRSLQGTISSLDLHSKTLCIDGYPPICLLVDPELPIYLDYSTYGQPSLLGSWENLYQGVSIEYYPNHWIKVRE